MANHLQMASIIFLLSIMGCRDRTAGKSVAHPLPPSVESKLEKPCKIHEFRDPVVVTFHPPKPKYPPELKQARIEGDIRLVLHLNREGKITKIDKEFGLEEFRPSAEAFAWSCRFDVDPSEFTQNETIPFRLTLKYILPPKQKSAPSGH